MVRRDTSKNKQMNEVLQRSHDELQKAIAVLQNANKDLMKQLTNSKQIEDELHYRIAFENLITTLSTKFISLKPDEIDWGIEQALREIGEFTGDDRSWVMLYYDDWKMLDNTHEWLAEGIKTSKVEFNKRPIGIMPWVNEKIRHGEVVHIPRVVDLPPEASIDKALIQSVSTQSLIFVPMIYRNTVIGSLGFDSVRSERSWSEESITLLKAVGEMFVNALQRKWIEEELQESQQTLATLMGNLPGMAYRLRNDRNGTIEFVSEGCQELTGYTSAELVENKKLSYIHLVHPEDRKAVRLAAMNSLQEQKSYCHIHRFLTATKEVKWVWEKGCGVIYRGNLVWEGFITDATDRVLAFQVLEERVEQRTREIQRRRAVADGLREVMAGLNENRPLPEVLDHIVEQAGHLLCTEKLAIYQLLSEKGVLNIKAGRGLKENYVLGSGFSIEDKAVERMAKEFQPLAITLAEKTTHEDVLVKELRKVHRKSMSGPCRSLLFVPLTVAEKMYGALILYYTKARDFSSEDVGLAITFGQQAILAIENAWLRKQAEENAAAKERNRIASELHDSVTQTLFSTSIIAEALPFLLQENDPEAQRNLEQLQVLTRGALSEMRALLLELRPTTQKDADLEQMLRCLIDEYATRGRLPILLTVEGHRVLPTNVQVGLYQVAREALNNILKHSNATKVDVGLQCGKDIVTLRISDDGCGFEPSLVPPEHLGLAIMRERAAAIGASLSIDSQVGRGTEVLAIWLAQ